MIRGYDLIELLGKTRGLDFNCRWANAIHFLTVVYPISNRNAKNFL